MTALSMSMSKYKLSRLSRKLQLPDDQRTVIALPKEVPERTWAEILQKEEVELSLFELREQILENALNICYENYMEKQTTAFMAHCAATAWLKLIDWHFYRHDPGEDPSAVPACYIPKRAESWIPDEVPEASPKDTWGLQDLTVMESTGDEVAQKKISFDSLKCLTVDEIPSEYWFPGRVSMQDEATDEKSGMWTFMTQDTSVSTELQSADICTESEVLQKVTDYAAEEVSKGSTTSVIKTSRTSANGSIQGAGDSQIPEIGSRPKIRRPMERRKSSFSSRRQLPPLDLADSKSRISIISDCRLRNLRLYLSHLRLSLMSIA